MTSIVRRLTVAVTTVAVVFAAAACFPQDGSTPTSPPVPSGGRALLSGNAGYQMQIEDATGDLSRVIVLQHQWIGPGDPVNGRYSLYDDATGTTTLLPVKETSGGMTTVRLLPDGHRIIFGSNDPALQIGPVAANCWKYNGLFQPLSRVVCAELYLYDLTDGSIRQLTGLDGSSSLHNVLGKVSPDGTTVSYTEENPIPEGGGPVYQRRLDLATGASTDDTTPDCCTWIRGNHRIVWSQYSSPAALTSEDLDTGQVTTLNGPGAVTLESHTDDAHFVVLGHDDQKLHLIDTDTGTDRIVPSSWISADGLRYLLVQNNVLPENRPRLVVAPVKW
jgi:hypothetical protein